MIDEFELLKMIHIKFQTVEIFVINLVTHIQVKYFMDIVQYLHIYMNYIGKIRDKHVHDKLTWFLKCGSFSYSEIPKDFYAIMGVTYFK